MFRPPKDRGSAGKSWAVFSLVSVLLLALARADDICLVFADDQINCKECKPGAHVVKGVCVPDNSCAHLEGCACCAEWNSPLCGVCESGYRLIEDMKICLKSDFCKGEATGCSGCEDDDPRKCTACTQNGYELTQDDTMCIPAVMTKDRYCAEADENDANKCKSCLSGRTLGEDGRCRLSAQLTTLSGCYEDKAILTLDFFSGQACLKITPTGARGCEPLARNSGVHVVFSASTLFAPIEADLPSFTYATTTSVCVYCPDENFAKYRENLTHAQAGTVDIQTFSHHTVIPVTAMDTQLSNFSNCFESPASIHVKKSTYEVCAEAVTTNRCSSLKYIDVREFSMTLDCERGLYTYNFDPVSWNPYSSMFCVKCADEEGRPTECFDFAKQSELDPWITGKLAIRGFIDEKPMAIHIDLPYMVNDYQADCFSAISVVLFRNKLDLTLNPSEQHSEECHFDKSIKKTKLSVAVYAEGVQYPLFLEYTRDAVDLEETTLVRFYYEDEHKESVEQLLVTPLSLMSEIIIQHQNRRGDTVATTRRKADTVQVGSYDNVCAYYYADKVCFRIFPLLSPNGVVASDLSSDVTAEAVLQLSTSDPLVNEDLVSFKAEGHFERDVSNICFPCSSATSIARGYTCQSALARTAKDMTLSVSSIRLFFHASGTQGNWLLATVHYRKNYTTVYVVGGCVAVVLLLPFVIHVAILFKSVRAERAKLKKLLRRARKAHHS